jgi:hypothetical protein
MKHLLAFVRPETPMESRMSLRLTPLLQVQTESSNQPTHLMHRFTLNLQDVEDLYSPRAMDANSFDRVGRVEKFTSDRKDHTFSCNFGAVTFRS